MSTCQARSASPASAVISQVPASQTSTGKFPYHVAHIRIVSAIEIHFSPEFYFDTNKGIFFGGQFLDGRAATLEEQAKQPLLNPVEMGNPDKFSVVEKVSRADYAADFKVVYGENIFNDVSLAFDKIAEAIDTLKDLSKYLHFLQNLTPSLRAK